MSNLALGLIIRSFRCLGNILKKVLLKAKIEICDNPTKMPMVPLFMVLNAKTQSLWLDMPQGIQLDIICFSCNPMEIWK